MPWSGLLGRCMNTTATTTTTTMTTTIVIERPAPPCGVERWCVTPALQKHWFFHRFCNYCACWLASDDHHNDNNRDYADDDDNDHCHRTPRPPCGVERSPRDVTAARGGPSQLPRLTDDAKWLEFLRISTDSASRTVAQNPTIPLGGGALSTEH